MSRSRIFWILICIAIGGTLLRAYELTNRSLWFDEAFSWRLIQFPFSEMLARASTDVHPPLYYTLLQGYCVVFGSSVLAIRSFSIVCAAVAVWCTYLYAAYAFRSRRAGMYAALLFAVSPWAISYAWEARMYPLGMIFALLSSYTILRAIRDKSLRWFGVYGVLAAAFIYTHYYGFFTIAAQVLFVLAILVQSTKWRIGEMVHSRILYGILLSLCTVGLLFSPWLPTFLQQRSQVETAYWIPPLSLWSVPDTFYRFFLPTVKGIPHHGPILMLSLLPIVGVLLLWVYSFLRYKKIDGVLLTIFLGTIPLILSICISLGSRSLYNDRFFAFTGIFIFSLLAYVLSAIRKPLARRIAFFVVLIGSLSAFAHYWNELDIASKVGAHSAARYVFTHRTNNEHVVVSSPFVYFAILHYATEEFSAKEVPHLYSKTGELSHFSGAPITTQEDIVGPSDIEGYAGTVWVVDTTGFSEQPFAAPKNWKEVSREVFPEVFVYQGDVIVRKFSVK